jgi:hypothetical protein
MSSTECILQGARRQAYEVVSKWSLEVWSGFGQYALCNGYPPKCIGNEKFLVGREAATGFKDLCGQCSDNSQDVGSWFSLSAAGQCKGKTEPDGKSCSWRAGIFYIHTALPVRFAI